MPEPKTMRTKASVPAFLAAIEHEQRRADAKSIAKLMQSVTGEKPAMWGASIVGFGAYESNTGTWPLIAFSPRKTSLVLYLGDLARLAPLLRSLGKHKTGKGCLYLNKLADVDASALRA